MFSYLFINYSRNTRINCFVSPLRECFGKKLEPIQKLLALKEKCVSLSDLLVNLFYIPLQHLHEYSSLLLKLSTCFDVVSAKITWLEAPKAVIVAPVLKSFFFSELCWISNDSRWLLAVWGLGSSSKQTEERGREHIHFLEELFRKEHGQFKNYSGFDLNSNRQIRESSYTIECKTLHLFSGFSMKSFFFLINKLNYQKIKKMKCTVGVSCSKTVIQN